MNARERITGLVAYLRPGQTAAVMREDLAELLEMIPDVVRPPASGVWTLDALGLLFPKKGKPRSRSALRADIQAGRFGAPNTPGGPHLEDGAWLVPHAAVERRLAELRGDAADGSEASPPATAAPATGAPPRGQGAIASRRGPAPARPTLRAS